jgi:hypothetical protein
MGSVTLTDVVSGLPAGTLDANDVTPALIDGTLGSYTGSQVTGGGGGGGYEPLDVSVEAGATYTLTADDSFTLLRLTHATPAVTVPDDADVVWPVGAWVYVDSVNGDFTLTEDTAVTVTEITAISRAALLVKTAADTWDAIGFGGGGAVAASAVTYAGATGMSATDVEAAIDELAAEKLSLVAGGASVEDIGAVESNVNTVATSGATETLDTSVYGVHDVTMDQACTFTFSNPAPSGKATIFTLILRGAFTPTFPAAVDWGDASAPTYTTPSVYTFLTVDAGTTWLGAQVGKAFG